MSQARQGATRLPELIDQRGIRQEMGVGEATAEAIFRALPVIRIPGHRKAFVRRQMVLELIERHECRADEAA